MAVTTTGRKGGLWGAGLLVLALFVTPADARDEKWRFVGFTRYRDALYVDMNRTKVAGEGILSVWTRITPKEKSLFRGRLRQDLHRLGKSGREVKFLEMNKEIDCRRNRIRHVKLIYYDRRERLVVATGDPRSPWKPIQLGSLWPDLQKAVCGVKK